MIKVLLVIIAGILAGAAGYVGGLALRGDPALAVWALSCVVGFSLVAWLCVGERSSVGG